MRPLATFISCLLFDMSRFPKHSKKCVFVEVVTLSVMSDYRLPFVDEETGSGGWWLVCLRLSWFYNRCATPQVTSGPDAAGFCPDGIALVRISLRRLLHGRCFHPNHRPSSVVFLPPLTCCRPGVWAEHRGGTRHPLACLQFMSSHKPARNFEALLPSLYVSSPSGN